MLGANISHDIAAYLLTALFKFLVNGLIRHLLWHITAAILRIRILRAVPVTDMQSW